MLGRSITINSLILVAFAIVTAGALATTFVFTADRIADQQRLAAEKALLEIIPRERHTNSMLDTFWQIPETLLVSLGLNEPAIAYVALNEDQPVAIILPSTAPDGYSGDIHTLIGINFDGTVAGVRVINHKETPGLGDKVDLNKSDWVLEFNSLSLSNPSLDDWKVKKDGGDFDQFTGATITPRAVVNRVKNTLLIFQDHKQQILSDLSLKQASKL